MKPNAEMQRIAAKFCGERRVGRWECGCHPESRTCGIQADPDCPFLAALLAAMPTEEPRDCDDLIPTPEQMQIDALTARVKALEAKSEERERPILYGGRPA